MEFAFIAETVARCRFQKFFQNFMQPKYRVGMRFKQNRLRILYSEVCICKSCICDCMYVHCTLFRFAGGCSSGIARRDGADIHGT